MQNEFLFRRALQAAYAVGERIRLVNDRTEWTDEEYEAAATELKRRLLGEEAPDAQ